MCTFPSWIKDEKGKYHWLVDKDVERSIENETLGSWEDGVGHGAIERVLGVSGKHMEGHEGVPKRLLSDIKGRRCLRMMNVENGVVLRHRYLGEPIPKVVKGNMDLKGSKVKSLPKGLKVGGNLFPRGSKVKSLPEGLKVGGGLFLRGSEIESQIGRASCRERV